MEPFYFRKHFLQNTCLTIDLKDLPPYRVNQMLHKNTWAVKSARPRRAAVTKSSDIN